MPEATRYCRVQNENTKDILKDLNIRDSGETITIGIYFHILYNTNSKQVVDNITYSLDMLNKDFRCESSNFNYGYDRIKNKAIKDTFDEMLRVSSKGRVPLIQFKSSGYKIYKNYNLTTDTNNLENILFTRYRPIKQEEQMNMYILPGSRILGFAMFPWWEQVQSFNGVVINSKTFGKSGLYRNYNLNKTMTHEVGHWLGLLHTFQQNNPESIQDAIIDYNGDNVVSNGEATGDCVVDTYNQLRPTFGNPIDDSSYDISSLIYDNKCCMFCNYMDYSNDICLFTFTKDQYIKMRLFIQKFRPKLVPEATTPQETTQETTPQATTPQATTPQATTPQETTPQATIQPSEIQDTMPLSFNTTYYKYTGSDTSVITITDNYISMTDNARLFFTVPDKNYTTFEIVADIGAFVGYVYKNKWYISRVKTGKYTLRIPNANSLVIGTFNSRTSNNKLIINDISVSSSASPLSKLYYTRIKNIISLDGFKFY